MWETPSSDPTLGQSDIELQLNIKSRFLLADYQILRAVTIAAPAKY